MTTHTTPAAIPMYNGFNPFAGGIINPSGASLAATTVTACRQRNIHGARSGERLSQLSAQARALTDVRFAEEIDGTAGARLTTRRAMKPAAEALQHVRNH